MAGALRKEVLSLYRKIIKTGKTWTSPDPERTPLEKKYIQDQARLWFRHNSQVTDHQAILDHIREGEARLEMALHYRNPHPRPVNLPPKSYTKKEGKKSVGRAQEQLRRQSRPVYVKSIDTESGIKDGS